MCYYSTDYEAFTYRQGGDRLDRNVNAGQELQLLGLRSISRILNKPRYWNALEPDNPPVWGGISAATDWPEENVRPESGDYDAPEDVALEDKAASVTVAPNIPNIPPAPPVPPTAKVVESQPQPSERYPSDERDHYVPVRSIDNEIESMVSKEHLYWDEAQESPTKPYYPAHQEEHKRNPVLAVFSKLKWPVQFVGKTRILIISAAAVLALIAVGICAMVMLNQNQKVAIKGKVMDGYEVVYGGRKFGIVTSKELFDTALSKLDPQVRAAVSFEQIRVDSGFAADVDQVVEKIKEST
jgi:hypothetical protein